jgi:NAD(P)-dependent dehydrogenase (short-subunit alcohol dehydrogenase family)
MNSTEKPSERPSLLLIGASRGLGHAMAARFVDAGWRVVGTVRGTARTPLHELAETSSLIEIEQLDINEPEQLQSLSHRLAACRFDMLFVNAGTSNDHPDHTIGEVSTDEFIRVMITNALSPIRAIETLQDLVSPDGLIGVMSSGQGSITNNEKGGREVYRGSKAALNQYMRCYAARHGADRRPLVLMAPGWIRTALGGPEAPYSIEEAVPQIVNVLLAQQGQPGLRYLDRFGNTVPW